MPHSSTDFIFDANIDQDAADDDSNRNERHQSASNGYISTLDTSQLPSLHASGANRTSNLPFRTHDPVPIDVVADTEDNDSEVEILTSADVTAIAAQELDEDLKTCRKRKRFQVETKSKPTECSICCEFCTMGGRHRLVALRCGHLFGRKCIERWINERHRCPNCSAVMLVTDICLLFSDHVAVVDNAGLKDMTKKYKDEKVKNTTLVKEIQTLTTHLEAKTRQVLSLTTELVQVQKALATVQCSVDQKKISDGSRAVSSTTIPRGCVGSISTTPPSQPTTQLMQFQSTLQEAELCGTKNELQRPEGDEFAAAVQKYKPLFDVPLSSARVFSIDRSCSLLCVGEKFGQDLFGVMVVVAHDPRHRLQVPVHRSAVRDMSIHPMTGHVLTVAFDGKLAVTDLCQNKVMLEGDFPVGRRQGWSCCFSKVDPHAMYCGFQDGTVAKYDMRKLAAGEEGIVRTFTLPERQPVHSIKLFHSNVGRSTEGLAAATFRGLSVWRDVINVLSEPDGPVDNRNGINDAAPFHHVPSTHACVSLSSNQLHTEQMVVSLRSVPMTHSVFDLHTVERGRMVPRMEVTGHQTASVLSRSALWSERNGTAVVASWSQDMERITLWNIAQHREVCGPEPILRSVYSSAVPVVDIHHTVAFNDWNSGIALLGTITSRQLCVYRSSG